MDCVGDGEDGGDVRTRNLGTGFASTLWEFFLMCVFLLFFFFINAWTPGFLTPMQQLKIMRALLF